MEHSITNMRAIYWSNSMYRYPLPWLRKKGSSGTDKTPGNFPSAINTGWHIIPNLLWGHLCTPRQWWEMVIKFEAISVRSVKTRIFNPIPIQTALSFQATGSFPAFNNTVYSITYTDDLYETPWFDWHSDVFAESTPVNMFYEYNPMYKEGAVHNKSPEFNQANDVAPDRKTLEDREDIYPRQYYSKITSELPASYQPADYRRQFLPIYWYHYPFPQYNRQPGLTQWRDTLSWWENSWFDPSGTFWDPLNRPEHIGELRPGKNMIEFSWSAHPSDTNIWFNLDRVALNPPYPRPRPLHLDSGGSNPIDKPHVCNPTTPGPPANAYEYLIRYGLIQQAEDLQVPIQCMAPETHIGLPNWRDYPIVPMRWFMKEVQQSNPWSYCSLEKTYYQEQPSKNGGGDHCPRLPQNSGSGWKQLNKGDADIIAPMENSKFPGTEYEMYKYPPTQWFIKGVPLFDDKDKHILVQMQAFMITTLSLVGKPRRSAIYAPTWGPIIPQDLYTVNMDATFGESYIRGRSGGARRTWYNPKDTRPTKDVNYEHIELFKGETNPGGVDQPGNKVPQHPKYQCILEPRRTEIDRVTVPRMWSFQDTDLAVYVSNDSRVVVEKR